MDTAPARSVRFGLVGYGAWGGCHARAIQKHARLVAVCAATETTRKRARGELGPDVAIEPSYAALVRRDDVDVVDIVVPNHLHREVAIAALTAGKHVLLEKPMATTVADAEAIAAAARTHQRILAIGHEARLSPQWGKIKQLIDAGAIGQPLSAAIHLWRFPYRQGAGGWRYNADAVGDWTLEEPIHYFDLLRWYLEPLGPPQIVYARANSVQVQQRPNLYDNLAALVTFPGGGFATVTQTLAGYEYHLRGEVVGTAGAIRTWWVGEQDRTDRPQFAFEYFDGKELHNLALESTPGELFELETEIAQMARAVGAGRQPLVGPEDGIWAVRLCLAAEESARRGVPVPVRVNRDEEAAG
ncbi:MAG TPA: Gfo/Idh/MocA family oxidoreductase [Chloroflexota bacterium]